MTRAKKHFFNFDMRKDKKESMRRYRQEEMAAAINPAREDIAKTPAEAGISIETLSAALGIGNDADEPVCGEISAVTSDVTSFDASPDASADTSADTSARVCAVDIDAVEIDISEGAVKVSNDTRKVEEVDADAETEHQSEHIGCSCGCSCGCGCATHAEAENVDDTDAPIFSDNDALAFLSGLDLETVDETKEVGVSETAPTKKKPDLAAGIYGSGVADTDDDEVFDSSFEVLDRWLQESATDKIDPMHIVNKNVPPVQSVGYEGDSDPDDESLYSFGENFEDEDSWAWRCKTERLCRLNTKIVQAMQEVYENVYLVCIEDITCEPYKGQTIRTLKYDYVVIADSVDIRKEMLKYKQKHSVSSLRKISRIVEAVGGTRLMKA